MAPFSQLLLDPQDPFRLAFVLRNSGCGVVDLAARAVTHFCPMLPSATSTLQHPQACWDDASGCLLTGTAAPPAPAMLRAMKSVAFHSALMAVRLVFIAAVWPPAAERGAEAGR